MLYAINSCGSNVSLSNFLPSPIYLCLLPVLSPYPLSSDNTSLFLLFLTTSTTSTPFSFYLLLFIISISPKSTSSPSLIPLFLYFILTTVNPCYNSFFHRTMKGKRHFTAQPNMGTLRWFQYCFRSWPIPPWETADKRLLWTWQRCMDGYRSVAMTYQFWNFLLLIQSF